MINDVDLRYFVLLMNCQNDERVKSVILDRRETLARAGYAMILGLRDLYPSPIADLPAVKNRLKYGVPTLGVPIHILLAVAEIEAWFIQEHSHFVKIDKILDVDSFKAKFAFDPRIDCAEELPQPSATLRSIYNSVGKGYDKSKKHVQRTVDALDYASIYSHLPEKLPHLKEFVSHLDAFLS